MTDLDQAKAHFLAALALLDAKDFVRAEAPLRAALAIVPDRASVVTNLAVALLNQERLVEACALAQRAAALAPEAYESWLVLGSVLTKLRRLDEALRAMERCVAAERNAQSLMGRAHVHSEAKRFDLALADYDAAMAIDPTEEFLPGLRIAAQMQICDWTNFGARVGDLLAGVRSGKNLVNHVAFLSMPGATAADQLKSARAIAERDFPSIDRRPAKTPKGNRIRLAYVSGDFHDHPVGALMAGVLAQHDRRRFEVAAISFGPDDDSAVRTRIRAHVEHFVDLRGESDGAIAQRIRDFGADIAVDLGGFTNGGRPRVFAQRPAPIQVAYLGHPGTTGSSAIDYLLADRVIVPDGARGDYSEQIVRLPNSCYPADNTLPMGATPSRASAGLPPSGFVFASFNSSYKITPDVFDVWMRLLRDVEGSVLWLASARQAAMDNLRATAKRRGVDPSRLIFAPRVPIEQHLARHALAGVFLDTAPYNAHATACDALRAGLPIVTCPGGTYASRVGASLLSAAGLPQLVVSSWDEYYRLALSLAREPGRLAAVKAKLAANLTIAPLFDTARTTRHLEAAYSTMVERYQRDEAPTSFDVADLS